MDDGRNADGTDDPRVEPVSRRRFTAFSLRAMFVSVAFAGGVFYYLKRCHSLMKTRQCLAMELDKVFCGAIEHPRTLDEAIKHAVPGTLEQPTEQAPISWVRRMMGDKTIYVVIIWNGTIDPSTDKAIRAAFPEAHIWRVERE